MCSLLSKEKNTVITDVSKNYANKKLINENDNL